MRVSEYARYNYFYDEVFAMIVTAWKNGTEPACPSGAEYGVSVETDDRDRYFQKDWETIELELQGYAHVVKVNVATPSFWSCTCRELTHSEIGQWLIDNGLDSWNLGTPPKLSLKFIGGNRFRLMK